MLPITTIDNLRQYNNGNQRIGNFAVARGKPGSNKGKFCISQRSERWSSQKRRI